MSTLKKTMKLLLISLALILALTASKNPVNNQNTIKRGLDSFGNGLNVTDITSGKVLEDLVSG